MRLECVRKREYQAILPQEPRVASGHELPLTWLGSRIASYFTEHLAERADPQSRHCSNSRPFSKQVLLLPYDASTETSISATDKAPRN